MDVLLQQAISAIKAGDKARGKQLLIKVLELDSSNETAWLWMSQCVDSVQHQLECFKRVLEINPKNPIAQREIARLQTLARIKSDSTSATAIKRKPKRKTWLAFSLLSSIFLICVCTIAYLSLSKGSGQPDQPSATQSRPAVIIDVPSLFGRSLNEIRSQYSIALYEDLHPLVGYEDILPSSVLSEGYSKGEYSFYIFYDESQTSVGFQLYDGLESHHLRINDWQKITQMLYIDIARSPDFIDDYRAEWDQISGYHIEIIRNISGQYVFAVVVVESR